MNIQDYVIGKVTYRTADGDVRVYHEIYLHRDNVIAMISLMEDFRRYIAHTHIYAVQILRWEVLGDVDRKRIAKHYAKYMRDEDGR